MAGGQTTKRKSLLAVAGRCRPRRRSLPASEDRPDRSGRIRELGAENYANRILRYLDQAKADDGQYELVRREVTYLSSTLDYPRRSLPEGHSRTVQCPRYTPDHADDLERPERVGSGLLALSSRS
jgi:hypothetical protein